MLYRSSNITLGSPEVSRGVAIARHEYRRRGVRPPMYRITGHYPVVSPAGHCSETGSD